MRPRRWDHFGVYVPFGQLMDRAGFNLALVRAIAATRKSDEDDRLAIEQAGKALGVVAKTEPDLRELLTQWPVETWLTPHGRRACKIVDVRVCDVMPWRLPGDPNGSTVVGQLLVHRSVACFVVANSGFTSAQDEEMVPRNPYAIAVEQLMKAVRQATGMQAKVRLRLATDTTRKGRLAIALGRMDHFRRQLEVELWYGDRQMSDGQWADLIEGLTNVQNETQRTVAVTNLLTGRLGAITKGNLPGAEVNLPPTLQHRIDPDRRGVDKRARTGAGHLETFHAVEIQPALAEYLAAFARGASDTDLAVILRKHRVPTGTPGKTVNRHSRQRDTTFDQLPFARAVRRAGRWLTYQDHKMRPVPPGGDPEVELTNSLAVRKIGLVADGAVTLKWTNPTPGVTAYEAGHHGDVIPVVRTSHFDAGRVEPDLVVGFPDRRVTRTESRWIDATGAPCDPATDGATQVEVQVVTDEIVVDAAGQPVPWERWGIDPTVLWLAAERVWVSHTTAAGALLGGKPRSSARLLGFIDGWWRDHDGARTRQWKLWPRGSSERDVQQVNRYRWLIWRDIDEAYTSDGVLRGWTDITDGLTNRAHSADRDWKRRHVATFNEATMLTDVVRAMKHAVRQHLAGDLTLETPASSRRDTQIAARAAATQSQIDAVAGQATAALQEAEQHDAAVGFHAQRGNDGKAEEADRRADTARAEAARLLQTKHRLEVELADVGADDQPFDAAAFTTVAELIAFLEASIVGDWAARRGPGDVPADLAHTIAKTFTGWHVTEPYTDVDGSSNCDWSCTWALTMTDGTVRTLPLSGRWENTMKGLGAACSTDREVARDVLLGRRTLDQAIAGLTRTTSRERVWKHRIRPVLGQWGVHHRLRAAAYDNPSATTREILAVTLGGAPRPPDAGWSPELGSHIVASYDGTLRHSWQDAAVPGDLSEMHALFEAVCRTATHRAYGVALKDLEASRSGRARIARQMVTPPTSKKATQPQMLAWRDQGVVGPIRCPHAECVGTGAVADLLLYLPETTPATDGSIGGVLCRNCRRIPRLDCAGFQFTPDYLQLTRYTGAAYRTHDVHLWDGLSHQLPTLLVPHLPAFTKRTMAVIQRTYGLSRYATERLLADVPTHRERTTPGRVVHTLYDLDDVRRAVRDAGIQPAAA